MQTGTQEEQGAERLTFVNLSPDARTHADAIRGVCLVSGALPQPIAGGPVSCAALARAARCSDDLVRRLIGLAIHCGFVAELAAPSGPGEGRFGAVPWQLAVTPKGQRALAEAAAEAARLAQAKAAEAARLGAALQGARP